MLYRPMEVAPFDHLKYSGFPEELHHDDDRMNSEASATRVR